MPCFMYRWFGTGLRYAKYCLIRENLWLLTRTKMHRPHQWKAINLSVTSWPNQTTGVSWWQPVVPAEQHLLQSSMHNLTPKSMRINHQRKMLITRKKKRNAEGEDEAAEHIFFINISLRHENISNNQQAWTLFHIVTDNPFISKLSKIFVAYVVYWTAGQKLWNNFSSHGSIYFWVLIFPSRMPKSSIDIKSLKCIWQNNIFINLLKHIHRHHISISIPKFIKFTSSLKIIQDVHHSFNYLQACMHAYIFWWTANLY